MKWLWLLLLIGYLSAAWASKKRRAMIAFFLDGFYLAMLCFAVLPPAFHSVHFYGVAACAMAGIGVGTFAEKIFPWDTLLRQGLFLFLAMAVFLPLKAPVFLAAFLGGMGLYHASAGILPEKTSIKGAFCSAGGFLLGVVCFLPRLY